MFHAAVPEQHFAASAQGLRHRLHRVFCGNAGRQDDRSADHLMDRYAGRIGLLCDAKQAKIGGIRRLD